MAQQTGACCFNSGSCQVLTQTSCLTSGGNFQGSGTNCTPNPCGACCFFMDASCKVENAAHCTTDGGTFKGTGTNCSPNLCGGACCIQNPYQCQSICHFWTEAYCTTVYSGTYYGDGVTCAQVTCALPTGACCLNGGGCSITPCNECTGTYQGNNTTCTSDPCPGACCFVVGYCSIVGYSGACTGQGGTYQGNNTDCTPNPCPQPGACCDDEGFCSMSGVIDPGDCGTGNTYQGDNTDCNPNPCPQPGACCLQDGSCEVSLETACATAGGVFQGENTTCMPNLCPQPSGAPRAWGAGLAVSPFSGVNLDNGNVLTVLPLVSWKPVGPAVSFALYHNSIVSAYGGGYSAWGFDLGAGWSVSFGGHIEGSYGQGDGVAVVGDDGAVNFYTWDTNHYDPPAGVHDILTWDGLDEEWTLLSPAQSKAVFEQCGQYARLKRVCDSAGNVVTVHRDAENGCRIDYIASAADGLDDGQSGTIVNRLTLSYREDGKLDSIQDALPDPSTRTWTFHYEETGDERLVAVEYPTDDYVDPSDVEFTYETLSDRIATVTSRDSKMWAYTYTGGRLATVTDPGPGQTPYTQAFSYNLNAVNGLWATTYTDRRGKDWVYRFDAPRNLREGTNPLNKTRHATYDGQHNRLTTTDELGHTWTFTYGAIGNPLTVSSPLTGNDAQTWTLTWQAPGQGEPANLYRLTEVSDPLSYDVTYAYEDANDPTLVTSITEPADGEGNEEAVTTLEYYGTETPNALGQLKLLTEANGVASLREWDNWGYVDREREGLPEGDYPWIRDITNDPMGRLVGNGLQDSTTVEGPDGPAWTNCSELVYCANDLPVEDICCIFVLHGGNPTGCPWRMGALPGELPTYPQINGAHSDVTYDVVGRPLTLDRRLPNEDFSAEGGDAWPTRKLRWDNYDNLGRLTDFRTISGEAMGEHVWEQTRVWGMTYGDAAGPTIVAGPEGADTTYEYEDAGRVETITRGSMGAVYHYDDAGRLTQIDHTDATNVVSKVLRTYDNADRVTQIEHKKADDTLLLRITYVYNRDNTVGTRTEYDNTGQTAHTALVTFGYDARKRLTSEVRALDETDVYDLTYTYDQLGNRRTKTDDVQNALTKYVYDTDWDPANGVWRGSAAYTPGWSPAYATCNNRLLEYRVLSTVGGETLLRTVRYTYYVTGHVSDITVKDEWTGQGETPDAYNWYYNLALYYTLNGELYRAHWSKWKVTEGEFTDFTPLALRDFAYDSPRARYYTQAYEWRYDEGWGTSLWFRDGPGHYTDYLDEQPYGDWDVTAAFNWQTQQWETSGAEAKRYVGGDGGLHAQQTLDGQTDPIRYLHGDLIDSTMMPTDEGATAVSAVSYTAFGEAVGDGDALGTRYQYGGGWGYESGLISLSGANDDLGPITLQHVGARWYDPAIGRFVLRDPIGIEGGLNAYLYCDANPLATVDPFGDIGWPEVKDWFKAMWSRLANAGKSTWKWYTTRGPVKPGVGLGEVQTCVSVIGAVPDLARTWIAKHQRDRLIEEGGSDEAWGEYEGQGRRWIRPRQNLED